MHVWLLIVLFLFNMYQSEYEIADAIEQMIKKKGKI